MAPQRYVAKIMPSTIVRQRFAAPCKQPSLISGSAQRCWGQPVRASLGAGLCLCQSGTAPFVGMPRLFPGPRRQVGAGKGTLCLRIWFTELRSTAGFWLLGESDGPRLRADVQRGHGAPRGRWDLEIAQQCCRGGPFPPLPALVSRSGVGGRG